MVDRTAFRDRRETPGAQCGTHETRRGEIQPAAAPRLGAVELGGDGAPLRKHRIWDVSGVRDKRQALPGEPLTDLLSVPVGPERVDVTATWRFRRVNPDFAAFAFDEEPAAAVSRFSILELGSATVEVPAR